MEPPDVNDDFYKKKLQNMRLPYEECLEQVPKVTTEESNVLLGSVKKRRFMKMDDCDIRLQDELRTPVVNVVTNLVQASLRTCREMTKSVLAQTENVSETCEDLLLEIRSLSDAREISRMEEKKKRLKLDTDRCACGSAGAMMPTPAKGLLPKLAYDEMTEDQTDRALLKIEATLEKLRELTGMIERTSMEKEKELISKVSLPSNTLMVLAKNGVEEVDGVTFTNAQNQKLNRWYASYAKPYSHELITMVKILKLKFFTDDERANGYVTKDALRTWFNDRKWTEMKLHAQQIVDEAQRNGASLEELLQIQSVAIKDVEKAIQERIDVLRQLLPPNALEEEYQMLLKLDSTRKNNTGLGTIQQNAAQSDAVHREVVKQELPTQNGKDKVIPTGPVPSKVFSIKYASDGDTSVMVRQLYNAIKKNSKELARQVLDLMRSFQIGIDLVGKFNLVSLLKTAEKTFADDAGILKCVNILIERIDNGDEKIFNPDQIAVLEAFYKQHGNFMLDHIDLIVNTISLSLKTKLPGDLALLIQKWFTARKSGSTVEHQLVNDGSSNEMDMDESSDEQDSNNASA